MINTHRRTDLGRVSGSLCEALATLGRSAGGQLMPDEVTTRYPHAARAYAAHVLAALRPAELAALDRFAARALDAPRAQPRGVDETAAVRRVEGLIGPPHPPHRKDP